MHPISSLRVWWYELAHSQNEALINEKDKSSLVTFYSDSLLSRKGQNGDGCLQQESR